MIYHKDLKMYLHPGGHVDINEFNVLEAAKREVFEETGIKVLESINICENKFVPFDIDTHEIEYNKRLDYDIKLCSTSIGPHKDDIEFYLGDKNLKFYGSQGQQRTAVLSLKLCELDIVKEETEDTPVLLLDDFMSELDEIRRKSFLENIKGSQVIITCTDRIDLETDFSEYFVENGICKII